MHPLIFVAKFSIPASHLLHQSIRAPLVPPTAAKFLKVFHKKMSKGEKIATYIRKINAFSPLHRYSRVIFSVVRTITPKQAFNKKFMTRRIPDNPEKGRKGEFLR